eukprot:1983891-Prorocentrum_lima.AAC.1
MAASEERQGTADEMGGMIRGVTSWLTHASVPSLVEHEAEKHLTRTKLSCSRRRRCSGKVK